MDTPADTSTRFYRLRSTKRAARALTILYGGGTLLAVVIAASKSDLPALGALGVLLVALLIFMNTTLLKTGVYEDRDGITVKGVLGSTHFKWDELAGFDHKLVGVRDLVFAVPTAGGFLRLSNLLQGQRVIWEDGETEDILGVLTERLHASRGTTLPVEAGSRRGT